VQFRTLTWHLTNAEHCAAPAPGVKERSCFVNAIHFDRWSRNLAAAPSRRRILAALFSGAVTSPFLPVPAAAGPGCKNIGKKCKKKKDCCSGVCKGKKGKKKCKAHDTGGCQAMAATCSQNIDCTTSTGEMGDCFTTTGNAGYCANAGECFPCTRDADCRPFCGPQAACARCTACLPGTPTTACLGPSGSSCNFAP
jgi:hypothetical protein